MKTFEVKSNKNFIGRQFECEALEAIVRLQEASILIVYGRRRVGKTELIEQVYCDRNLLKFEGLEGLSAKEQRAHVMRELADYTGNPLFAKVAVDSWTEVFKLIAQEIKEGTWTLYFEEVQWLAAYEDAFISELKLVWDNALRHNPHLLMVLCGSSPSFMINHVIKSKSLYNRSSHELCLRPFSVIETKDFLKKQSNRECMDAYLTLGGIPEYLKRLKAESSVLLGLCKESFQANGFFTREYEKIFISSLASNPYYKKIVEFLSKRKFATRNEILSHLKIKSGGMVSELLQDLELCGFIEKYTPYNLTDDSLLARYCISDPYFQFYFKFIKPIANKIEQGIYNERPTDALNMDTYHKWLGFAFERFCRQKHHLFAKLLGFESVNYQSGAFFNRATSLDIPGFQIDLLFDRADKVVTICEIKYLQTKVSKRVIDEFERKLALFPNTKNKTLQKVLITTQGAEEAVSRAGYFDRIITLDDIFSVK